MRCAVSRLQRMQRQRWERLQVSIRCGLYIGEPARLRAWLGLGCWLVRQGALDEFDAAASQPAAAARHRVRCRTALALAAAVHRPCAARRGTAAGRARAARSGVGAGAARADCRGHARGRIGDAAGGAAGVRAIGLEHCRQGAPRRATEAGLWSACGGRIAPEGAPTGIRRARSTRAHDSKGAGAPSQHAATRCFASDPLHDLKQRAGPGHSTTTTSASRSATRTTRAANGRRRGAQDRRPREAHRGLTCRVCSSRRERSERRRVTRRAGDSSTAGESTRQRRPASLRGAGGSGGAELRRWWRAKAASRLKALPQSHGALRPQECGAPCLRSRRALQGTAAHCFARRSAPTSPRSAISCSPAPPARTRDPPPAAPPPRRGSAPAASRPRRCRSRRAGCAPW